MVTANPYGNQGGDGGMVVTNIEIIPGRRIRSHLGIVQGHTLRSSSSAAAVRSAGCREGQREPDDAQRRRAGVDVVADVVGDFFVHKPAPREVVAVPSLAHLLDPLHTDLLAA